MSLESQRIVCIAFLVTLQSARRADIGIVRIRRGRRRRGRKRRSIMSQHEALAGLVAFVLSCLPSLRLALSSPYSFSFFLYFSFILSFFLYLFLLILLFLLLLLSSLPLLLSLLHSVSPLKLLNMDDAKTNRSRCGKSFVCRAVAHKLA